MRTVAVPIRVLVADPSAGVRSSVSEILRAETDISVVGEAIDSPSVVQRALDLRPHIILMTEYLAQPGELEILAKNLPESKVIVFGSSQAAQGTSGVLLPQNLLDNSRIAGPLIQAIRLAAAGNLSLSASVVQREVANNFVSSDVSRLSARETEVLRLLSQGLSNSEIGDQLFVSDSTVKTYVRRVLDKLSLKNRAEAVAYYASRHQRSSVQSIDTLRTLNLRVEAGAESTTSPPEVPLLASAPLPESPVQEPLGDDFALAGERKQATALVAEIEVACSTELPQERVEDILDEGFALMAEEIRRYHGTVTWFTGRGIMSLFGVPASHEQSAQQALLAALALRTRLRTYFAELREQGFECNLWIGINTGAAVTQSHGDTTGANYIPAGNTALLAEGIQHIAEPNTIVVAQSTFQLTRDYFEFRSLGETHVPGDRQSIELYQLLGAGSIKGTMDAAVKRGLTQFVGRESELSLLKDCCARVKEGRGQVVAIRGEAGIGKSRFLLEMRTRLADREHSYFEGSCLYHGDSIPYLPILHILRSYFDIAEGQFESCIKDKIEDMVLGLDENLDGILPPLRDILGAGAADEMYLKLEPQQKRQKILEALRGLLIRLSQERPLILALEDLHWIDKSSEEFLTYLIEGMAGARILLVLLCRPEYSPPWSHKTYYTQISLDRLSDESATRMIQALLPEAQVSSDLNTFVVNKGEGNPLYIEELARNLIENGAVEREENRHILARGAREIQVPLTIQGIIAARIDRLELIVKQTLQVASVIGRDFSFGLLCQIRGGTQELGTHLQSLVQLEFIHQKTQFPEPEYTFKHALTQEVAYNSLLSRERRRLHQEIGRTIEAFHSAPEESAEMLAHHYCGSENWEKANWYLKLSGNKAVRSYANQEAIHFYEKSLVALKNMPCTKENINRQIEGLVLLLTPVVLMGFPQGHTEHLQEGERLAREAGDMRSLALFYNALAMYNCMHGIGSTATVYFDKALKAAEQVEDPELTARIAFDRWFRHFTQGTFAEMVEDTPQLSDMLDKTHRKYDLFGGGINSNLYATFCVGYGFCLGLTGRFDNGEAWCQEALEVAQRLDDPRTSALVYHIAGLVYHAMGRNKETILFFRSALEYVSETQTLWMAYQCNEFLGVAYAELGERQACQGFLDELRDSELTPINSGTIWPTGIAYLELGEMDEARTWLEKALIHCERIGEQCGQGIARIYLGRLWGKQEIPQYDEAEELLLEGIRRLEALQLKPWSTKGYLYLGELYGDMGQRDKAMENLTKAETAFREMGMNFWLQRTYQVLDRLK